MALKTLPSNLLGYTGNTRGPVETPGIFAARDDACKCDTHGLVLGCRSKGKQCKRFEGQTRSGSSVVFCESGGKEEGEVGGQRLRIGSSTRVKFTAAVPLAVVFFKFLLVTT